MGVCKMRIETERHVAHVSLENQSQNDIVITFSCVRDAPSAVRTKKSYRIRAHTRRCIHVHHIYSGWWTFGCSVHRALDPESFVIEQHSKTLYFRGPPKRTWLQRQLHSHKYLY